MKYYRIEEFADLVGISPTTLRKWDSDGTFVPAMRTPFGIRHYSEEQVSDAIIGNFKKWSKQKGGDD